MERLEGSQMHRRLLAAAAATVGMLLFTATAGATTLGTTTQPSGSSIGACSFHDAVVGTYTDDPATPYTVPAGGGMITQWQTYGPGDTPGSNLTLVVLQPMSGGKYTVVATDAETIPSTLPSDDILSFTPTQPIEVEAGDTFGFYTSSSGMFNCDFYNGSVPSAETLFATDSLSTPPTAGESLSLATTGVPTSPPGYELDLEVTLASTEDVGVTASSFPTSPTVGGAAVLSSVVTNAGPQSGPITFTDQVPSGLQIQSVAADGGSCSVSGQTATCTLTGLPAGQSATVDVVVTASAAGNYTNNVSVATAMGVTDPNMSNNSASATLAVTAPQQSSTPPAPAQMCIVPGLRKTPLGVARTVLKELGCTVKVVRQHSNVPKGLVIGIRGRTGTFAYKHKVTLRVSSGPKPKKHKQHKKH